MKRLVAALALGTVTVLGFVAGISTHVYAVRLVSFGRTVALPVVGSNGEPLRWRTFAPPLLAGVAGLALLTAYVTVCVTVAVRQRRDPGITLRGRPRSTTRRPLSSVIGV